MNSEKYRCEEITDKLVDYADGELAEQEAAAVAEHLDACARCRATLEALQRSLALAQVVWEDGEAELAKVETERVVHPRRNNWMKLAATAASILLVLAGALIWQVMQGESKPEKPLITAETETPVVEKEITLAEIEKEMFKAGLAAELLAMGDFIGAQPGGTVYARERYTYLAATYPDTQGAAQAKIRLKNLDERSIKNEID